MYEPIRDYLEQDVNVLVSGERLLGEKCGCLYGSADSSQYSLLGGAVYKSCTPTSKDMVGLGSTAYYHRYPLYHSLRRLWEAPLRLAAHAVVAAAFLLPAVRTVVPWALPPLLEREAAEALRRQRIASQRPERVVAVACHPTLPVVAVVVDEARSDGGARVSVYDTTREAWICVLSHAFQRHVEDVAWHPGEEGLLAVACEGGVLLWCLQAPESQRGARSLSDTAEAIFYRVHRRTRTGCLAFSSTSGQYLACGSRGHTELCVLDIAQPPHSDDCELLRLSPSLSGGIEQLVFSDDDSFIVSLVTNAAALVLVSTEAQGRMVTPVDTPSCVTQVEKATGIGMNYFFLTTRGLEGVLVARINRHIGVEVVSLISTAVFRGSGGWCAASPAAGGGCGWRRRRGTCWCATTASRSSTSRSSPSASASWTSPDWRAAAGAGSALSWPLWNGTTR
ncbi:hypothetical protein STCU_09555 [Strigomonas culicis]|uniref:Uncharacterized protein n=1 Tax=Strigomonas culicis TaxID=28005 RepID=S9TRX0_9TRYP|nr:hypothetical protein STCU_09555 [Strigomonas culicis]|eukprot:EPY19253.1 hypothetical protein STCU_09555 [Strigomonas culicis]